MAELVQKGAKLSSKQADRLNVVTTVYEQQRVMFESGTHSIPRRIVSLAQSWVRPIVRGKAHANTEFGPKLHISLVDGYARIERLAFCKEHGIRLSGPALGKPPKDSVLSRQEKKREYQDSCDHNAIEGIFGTAKTAYGLGRVMARLRETAVCVIGAALLLLSLSRSLRAALALFCFLCVAAILLGLRSRA